MWISVSPAGGCCGGWPPAWYAAKIRRTRAYGKRHALKCSAGHETRVSVCWPRQGLGPGGVRSDRIQGLHPAVATNRGKLLQSRFGRRRYGLDRKAEKIRSKYLPCQVHTVRPEFSSGKSDGFLRCISGKNTLGSSWPPVRASAINAGPAATFPWPVHCLPGTGSAWRMENAGPRPVGSSRWTRRIWPM